jgi:glycosyltransferase involved in cell wall biosynthesis
MRIAYVLDFFWPYVGGVQTMFLNLARQMVKEGHEVSVLTSMCGSDKRHEVLDGIDIHRCGNSRLGFVTSSVFDSDFRKKEFDVIHTSTYSSILPAYLLSKIKRTPSVLTVHEVWPLKIWREVLGIKGLAYLLEERALLSLPFNMYTCPSNYTKDALAKAGVRPDKIKVLPHGVDGIFSPEAKKHRKEMRDELGIPQDSVIGLFVGRPGVSKGINYLQQSLPKVFDQTGAKFLFLISKQPKNEYDRFVRSVKSSEVLSENISLVEPRPDHEFVAKLMGASDFVVVPSLTEGFCFVAAEAGATGVPTIAAAAGSLPEITDANVNSLHVAPRNVEDLSNAIIKITQDKELRLRLQNPRSFESWQEIARKYEGIYHSLG